MKKINFKLDDHEAWVLYEILDRVAGIRDCFVTYDEETEKNFYDHDLEQGILSLRNKLMELRSKQ